MNSLKVKNPDRNQAHLAFQHAVSKRFSVARSVMDNYELDLAERIVSAIAPQGDICSDAARSYLLKNATSEFVRIQELLICETYTGLAYQKKRLPLTGKGLLSICIQYSENSINLSENIEWLPSWQRLIFCYLARTFLQKMNVHMLDPTDSLSLVAELAPYFPTGSSTLSQDAKMQYATDLLAEDFVRSCSARSSKKNSQNLNFSIRYNEFLKCSSLIKNLLKGFFVLETEMCFSAQNLSNFQRYTKALHLPNAIGPINNAIQEIASICAEEHQNVVSCTRSLLEKATTLLRQIIFQSVAIAVAHKEGFQNKAPKDIVKCAWLPEKTFKSILFYNSWKEAIWAHFFGVLFEEDFTKDPKKLTSILADISAQLKTTFQKLCYSLLVDVLAEMPPECNENTLELFLAKARTLQTNMIPRYAPTSLLFAIVIEFLAKPENFVACNLLLDLAKSNFQTTQEDFVLYTCNFFLQNENYIPETPEELFLHLQKQVKDSTQIPSSLTKLPFWKNCIFLSLAHIFLQQKQVPMPLRNTLQNVINILKSYFPQIVMKKQSISDRLTALIKALAIALRSTPFEPIPTTTTPPPSIMARYDYTKYKVFFQSITSFQTFIQAFFKLDSGKNLSPKNLYMFQNYMNKLLPNILNIDTQEISLGSFTLHLEETQLLDEPSEEIKSALTTVSGLLKQLMEIALTILIAHKKSYKRTSPQAAVTEVFLIIQSTACVPEMLFASPEIQKFWKELIQTYSKKEPLSQILNLVECTEQIYTETASALTQCFLSICQKVLMHTPRKLFLQYATERSFHKQEQKHIGIISLIYPRIILESHQNQSTFKNLVAFLSEDALRTDNTKVLKLAIKNFTKSQQNFVTLAYSDLIQQKLSLPLTGEHFLTFWKKQYRSTSSFPLSLSKLSSWDDYIFCSLAYIFLIKNQTKINPDFHSWNPKAVINHIASFFSEATNLLDTLPIEIQIKTFTMCLTQYFSSDKSLTTDDTDMFSYACRAYENFLQSALLLKELFRTCFTIKIGNDFSSQKLSEIHKYIDLLLVNEPIHHRTSVIKDILIICSEETGSPTTHLSQLCTSLNYANSLINNIMQVSLALVMLKGTAETELTPQQTIESALTITSFPVSLTVVTKAFLNSTSGINALKAAMTEYLSDNLCIHMSEQFRLFSQETTANPLQTALDAHLSGQMCPQMIQYMQLLSSELLSTNETLTSLCKKLCIDMKENVTSAIPEDSSDATPSQKFMITANTCYNKVTFEEHTTMPLFRSLVLLLAQEYEEELQKERHEAFASFITTAGEFTIEEEPEELPDNIWQENRDTPLKETNEAALAQESNITTTPATEISPDELWPGIEALLSAEDFTDLLGTEIVQFEAEEEDAS